MAIPTMRGPATAPCWRRARRSTSWRIRCGENFAGTTQAVAYGETIEINGVAVTFRPAGHVLGSAQICVERDGLRIVASGDYKDVADPTCAPFEPIDVRRVHHRGDVRPAGVPPRRSERRDRQADELGRAVSRARAPDRRLRARQGAARDRADPAGAGYDKPIYLHGALENITRYYVSRGIDLGELRLAREATKAELVGAVALCPPSAVTELWARRFPDPVASFASGWMRVRARARQRGVELPLVISDHADWDGLTATIAATGAGEIWVTHGQEDALVHWCRTRGLKARPLRLVGYGEEEAEAGIE